MRLGIRRSSWQAFGTALSLEAVAVGGVLAWWALHPAEPALRALPLEIEAPSPAQELVPPAPLPEPPSKPLPTPVRQPHALTPPPPAPAPVLPPASPLPITTEPAAALASPAVAPAASPAPAVQPPPAPAPAPAATTGPSAKYIARVRAAVQAAFVYPLAAKAVGFQGRTRVAFSLHGAAPLGARVLLGSGMAVVDRAALQSVQAASYPPAPPEMKGADASFEVWVEFKP